MYLAIFLVLRYTGLISAVSSVTQKALFSTGAMDVSVDPVTHSDARTFNYDFELFDTDKKKINVSDFKGKTIFINVWATWCGPCRIEMPSIENLYKSVDKDKVVFIMLALDQNDAYNKVTRFIQDKEFTFPVYFPAGKLPDALRVQSIPTTLVVDSNGSIVFKEIGAANYDTDEFKKFINELK